MPHLGSGSFSSRAKARGSAALIGLLLGALLLAAPPASAQAPSNPCASEPFRQFDFWVGEWTVYNRDGSVAGENRIEKILGGCALLENWSGAGGSRGKSVNQYDYRTRQWKQNWVDAQGQRLDLVGAFEDGRMVLRMDTTDREGKPLKHQVTWTARDDGSVEQHWQATRDDGKTWQEVFFGVYRKK